ncbi:hypothetical protein [Mycobacterium paraterrae]|uniref:Uncharacterized protein n=1 Tax=Mycobacterium paraterrae TaxID=577492 RepID=A0ABY3VM10_9MYCO|nr:hypothetical protein [Mycobacterium paraterrae]UMB70470.1 hypothetical protein MKK62_03860 [Mycobacterium paraterrae]
MRTAVARVNVDPDNALTPLQLTEGMAALLNYVGRDGVTEKDLGAMPAGRREVELLISSEDAESAMQSAIDLCSKAFGTEPAAGVVTFVSRGTDDDAHGVLAGFGLSGDIVRTPGDDGFDIVDVTLREDDLDRIPESRVHTALEASLNCEVRIHTV